MKDIKQTLTRLLAAPNETPHRGELVVLKPATPLARVSPPAPPIVRPSVIKHYGDSVRQRMHFGIERKTAKSALPTLRLMTEQAKLATEYQTSLNALSLAELEREVRLAELEQRKLELAAQRRQHQHLESMRLQKEQLSLHLDITTLKRQIQEQRHSAKPGLTPAQQKAQKKAEIEEQLQQLRVEEARIIQHGASELEKRRLQNMYAARRDRLLEQLEKYL